MIKLTAKEYNKVIDALNRAEEVSVEWEKQGKVSFNKEMNSAIKVLYKAYRRYQK